MSETDPKRAWKIAADNRVCFYGWNGKQVPMTPIVREEEGTIYFLADVDSEKVTDIHGKLPVQLTFPTNPPMTICSSQRMLKSQMTAPRSKNYGPLLQKHSGIQRMTRTSD